MEKAQYFQRQARFQEELTRLKDELDKEQKETGFSPRDLARKHQEIAIVCVKYQQCDLAMEYFTKVLEYARRKHESSSSSSSSSIELPTEQQSETQEASNRNPEEEDLLLEETMMNNIGAMLLRSRDVKKATAFFHRANEYVKQEIDHQEKKNKKNKNQYFLNLLSINYALALHANGDLENAQLRAENVLQIAQNGEEDNLRITAFSLLASCAKSQLQGDKAIEYATQALHLAQASMAEPLLLARCLNNLGLYHFEQGSFQEALKYFVDSFRQAQTAEDFHQMAVVKYHIGIALAHLETELSFQLNTIKAQVHADESIKSTKTPIDCFEQTEDFASTIQDPVLGILAKTNLAQLDYYAGDFHTAQAGFSIALERLKELMNILNDTSKEASLSPVECHPESESATTPETTSTTNVGRYDGFLADKIQSKSEMIKIQGFLLSYLGSIHLIGGKFDISENFHRQDLDLAKDTKDIHAQLRAFRNLALVYNCSQKYAEAIPLWNESVQLANVLASKHELMMAYCGLGAALKEYAMWINAGAMEGSSPPELIKMEEKPVEIFKRQRALAIELNDKEQQIIAQRFIVNNYEISHPEVIQMEQRLVECDSLVKLCDQHGTLQHRADAYRSLASALNGQIARLAQRGSRFAEAVNVLTQKRDRVCDQYQQLCTIIGAETAATNKKNPSKTNPIVNKNQIQEGKTNEKNERQVFDQVEVFRR